MARRHPRPDAGFTLVEILVVLLILGLLAALALPLFLGQTQTGKDAEAKQLARTLQSQAESCHVESRSWEECDSAADMPKAQLPWGTGPGEVQVLHDGFGEDVVAFAATSRTGTVFAILRDTDDAQISRVCVVPSNAYPTGACKQGGRLSSLGFGSW